MMTNDKDQDNGINIKFGKDRDGKGKYRPVTVTKNNAINGTNNVKGKILIDMSKYF